MLVMAERGHFFYFTCLTGRSDGSRHLRGSTNCSRSLADYLLRRCVTVHEAEGCQTRDTCHK
ncbi:hypothetical protein HBI80_083740 [Parastagonospora nodorum]|nr:hypothetical protein HBI95_147330 [Parastagonospora nodorum]KAH4906311.1 hypothetical protein HBI80_083740 [Parastagonospora nodorum]KAH5185798.1 hypothetical protein HBH77_171440 [Parastagonospora nodorum]KAH5406907.1 hypothetical protein HBI32_153030 [Parastagonospora nodorum]KAH5735187.1 hypothetical protein HBI18_076420 [Parastagonospora nodorum]